MPAGARLRLLATGVPLPRPALARGPDELGLGFETVRFAARDGTPLEAWWVPSPGARGAVHKRRRWPVGEALSEGYGAQRYAERCELLPNCRRSEACQSTGEN